MAASASRRGQQPNCRVRASLRSPGFSAVGNGMPKMASMPSTHLTACWGSRYSGFLAEDLNVITDPEYVELDLKQGQILKKRTVPTAGVGVPNASGNGLVCVGWVLTRRRKEKEYPGPARQRKSCYNPDVTEISNGIPDLLGYPCPRLGVWVLCTQEGGQE